MTLLPIKKLEKIVDATLLEWFEPHGFVSSDGGGVERWHGDRYDFIGCIVNRIGGENRVSPFGQMGFLHTKKVFSSFMSDEPMKANTIAVDLQIRYANFMRDWTAHLRCQSADELEGFLPQLQAFVMARLYPALTSFRSPRAVFELYLRRAEKERRSFDLPVWSGFGSALTGLILARLHAPEHYESLKHRYRSEFDGLSSETLSRVERLINYLDQPDPLPPLS